MKQSVELSPRNEAIRKNGVFRRLLKPEMIIVIMLITVVGVGSGISNRFLDGAFLLDFMTIYVELGIIALAYTFLMISGEMDLSVASNMAFILCLVAVLFERGLPMEAAMGIGVICAVLLGLLNGVIVVLSGIPSLIITLGTMISFRGMAQVLIYENSIAGFPEWFNRVDKHRVFGFLPATILLFIVLVIVLEIILKRTFWGRKMFAIGTSAEVARYSAIKVDKMKIFVFGMVGLFCGIAAILTMSRLTLSKYAIGAGAELDVIIMVLMGGTAFSGGRGSVVGTAFAFVVTVFIRAAMMLVNLGGAQQMMVLGMILILVIIASTKLQELEKRR